MLQLECERRTQEHKRNFFKGLTSLDDRSTCLCELNVTERRMPFLEWTLHLLGGDYYFASLLLLVTVLYSICEPADHVTGRLRLRVQLNKKLSSRETHSPSATHSQHTQAAAITVWVQNSVTNTGSYSEKQEVSTEPRYTTNSTMTVTTTRTYLKKSLC